MITRFHLVNFIIRLVAPAGGQWPATFYFRADRKMPGSRYPILLYKDAFQERGQRAAGWLEWRFASNGWTNSWQDLSYPFWHYHSTAHEVLGIHSGSAIFHLGGEKGRQIRLCAGDIIVIPAGVGHFKYEPTEDFGMVGAYAHGRKWDLNKGYPGERPLADRNILTLPLPVNDPLLGERNGLRRLWR